ncbi:MAG: NADH-quinone oxidoreductase subunit J [Vicinamibacteria bacterium]|nr:NADH-quinone oxidoreductase subunit J [Vicinamibacteria bacterium]
MILDVILFYGAALVAIASGLFVISQRNPINSAFSLIITMCSLAVMFAMLGSGFIAVLQVVVYAGAIMVLFLFVIMLLNAKQEEGERMGGIGRAGIILGVILAIQSVMVVWKGSSILPANHRDTASVDVARGLFSDPRFLYPFEATSILILAAMVGAIVVARKEKGK